MEHDTEAQVVMYISGETSLTFRSLRDGEVVTEVPLGHRLFTGTSKSNTIATIGREPLSVIINDRHEHEQQQQLLELSSQPLAVAISPAQDTVAVMLENGMHAD
jgi:hypothetical protein